MKTFAVYQVHPFGGGKIVSRVTINTENEIYINIQPNFCENIIQKDENGNINYNYSLPQEARKIIYPHLSFYHNTISIRGAIKYNNKLHFSSVDIFWCDDTVMCEDFFKKEKI